MAWHIKNSNQMKKEFINKLIEPGVNKSEICRIYGISRKTGYKWLSRYKSEGERGLRERTRRPKTGIRSVSESTILRIVALRVEHRFWGADKIKEILRREGIQPLPSRATIHRILKQARLIKIAKKRREKKENIRLRGEEIKDIKVNDEWTIDFKGWWRAKDGKKRCYPLTIRDAKSRFILGVTLLEDSKEQTVRRAMIEVFKKYGLPKRIRSDNGSPFACTQALLGLSKLSAWWIRLGIEPVRGRVGCPQDNGAHERMHRDMKRELQAEHVDTQTEIDEWVHSFNYERPHQALGGDTPCMYYRKSKRRYEGSLIEFDYKQMQVRHIDKHGEVKWHSMDYFISEALRGETVGLKRLKDGVYEVWFGAYLLGMINEEDKTFSPEQEKGTKKRVIKAKRKQKAEINEFREIDKYT